MDMLARELHMDPFELREMNYLREGKVNALGEKMWRIHGSIAQCAEHASRAVFEKPKPAGRRPIISTGAVLPR